jgi:hypothetical protein
MVDIEILVHRIGLLPVADDTKQRLVDWIKATANDLRKHA